MDEPTFPPIVEVVSDAVILWDHQLGSILYSNGFFGKPLGLRKTKPGNQQRPLSLSLFDSLFLLENKVIQIKYQEMLLTLGQFLEYCKNLYENFEKKYAIYKFLREQGYVVRPGMKFGSDFAIYEIGPGFDHSKYVVHVENDELMLRAINIVRAGRLAASVKKQYLIATPQKSDEPNFYSFDRVKI